MFADWHPPTRATIRSWSSAASTTNNAQSSSPGLSSPRHWSPHPVGNSACRSARQPFAFPCSLGRNAVQDCDAKPRRVHGGARNPVCAPRSSPFQRHALTPRRAPPAPTLSRPSWTRPCRGQGAD
eukprot:8719996-Alexandrium_andersonii.AAC.1